MQRRVTLKLLVQIAQNCSHRPGRKRTKKEGCLVMSQSAVKQQSSSNAKSVGKTFAILSTFNEATPIQRTSDIASKLHMNISTVSRHLNTMLDWGYLQRDDATGFYSLGLEIVALAVQPYRTAASTASPIRSCSGFLISTVSIVI